MDIFGGFVIGLVGGVIWREVKNCGAWTGVKDHWAGLKERCNRWRKAHPEEARVIHDLEKVAEVAEVVTEVAAPEVAEEVEIVSKGLGLAEMIIESLHVAEERAVGHDVAEVLEGEAEEVEEAPEPAWEHPVCNINEATAEELEAVRGLGPDLARRIVKYREGRPDGRFESIEDLLEVSGIGSNKLNGIMPYLEI